MKPSEPYITKLIQLGLISEGFELPEFGADGEWGYETRRAYDEYVVRFKTEEIEIINCVVDLSHHNSVSDFNVVKKIMVFWGLFIKQHRVFNIRILNSQIVVLRLLTLVFSGDLIISELEEMVFSSGAFPISCQTRTN